MLGYLLTLAVDITNSEIIGSIENYKPHLEIRFSGSAYSSTSNTNAVIGYVTPSGGIALQGAGAGNKYIVFNVAYLHK